MKQLHTFSSYIMAIGPHPDDVEVGVGGTLYKTSTLGKKNVILDLTPSQLSTHGTQDTRLQESKMAADILGVHHRENLMLEDGNICDNCVLREKIAYHIRKRKPEIVVMPWKEDRHPDHECTAEVVKNAVFFAGLSKMDVGGLPPHKPRLLLYYMIWNSFQPDLILPLSDEEFSKKIDSFRQYQSQNKTNSWGEEYLKSRHVIHGHEIGVRYGEGFKLYSHSVGVRSFDDIVSGFF